MQLQYGWDYVEARDGRFFFHFPGGEVRWLYAERPDDQIQPRPATQDQVPPAGGRAAAA